MYFERVISLLFATTVISVFSYLLFFAAIGQAGNGGEYWGFSGYEDPYDAARRTFDSGDHRLLKVDLSTALGKRVSGVPIAAVCDGLQFGSGLPSRPSTDELIHGIDSVRLATEFAHGYNNMIAIFVGEEMQPPCYVRKSQYSSIASVYVEDHSLAYMVLLFYVAFFWVIYEFRTGRRHFKRRIDFVRRKIKERD